MPPLAQSAADKIPFTLGQLVVFRTLALAGSGAAAALTLSVSQPAISKSLNLLEQVPPVPSVLSLSYAAGNAWSELGPASGIMVSVAVCPCPQYCISWAHAVLPDLKGQQSHFRCCCSKSVTLDIHNLLDHIWCAMARHHVTSHDDNGK